MRLYERPKNRKQITRDDYVIKDYRNDTVVTAGFDKKVITGPEVAIPAFEQYFNIIAAVMNTLDSTLLDTKRGPGDPAG